MPPRLKCLRKYGKSFCYAWLVLLLLAIAGLIGVGAVYLAFILPLWLTITVGVFVAAWVGVHRWLARQLELQRLNEDLKELYANDPQALAALERCSTYDHSGRCEFCNYREYF